MDLCRSESSFHHLIYPIKVMCSGRVDPAMVLFAFEKGAEGVMVLGCKDKECRYGPGPEQSTKIAEPIKALIHILGLEPERFKSVKYSFNEKNSLCCSLLRTSIESEQHPIRNHREVPDFPLH